MCGRVIQSSAPIRYAIVDGMNVRDSRVHNYPPRWNGAPSQDLLVIRRNHKTGVASLDPLRWGLIPYWCQDPTSGRKPINAQLETLVRQFVQMCFDTSNPTSRRDKPISRNMESSNSPTRCANEGVATTRQGHGLVDPNGTAHALARTRHWCWYSYLPPCPITLLRAIPIIWQVGCDPRHNFGACPMAERRSTLGRPWSRGGPRAEGAKRSLPQTNFLEEPARTYAGM